MCSTPTVVTKNNGKHDMYVGWRCSTVRMLSPIVTTQYIPDHLQVYIMGTKIIIALRKCAYTRNTPNQLNKSQNLRKVT